MTNQKRSKIPYFFFAFFAVIFVVNISYIYISQKTWRGLATQDSYKKGLNYNEVLKLADEQQKLGWSVVIKYEPFSRQKGKILVSVLDKNSAPISDAKVQLNFKRPAQEGFDFSQETKFSGGFYSSEISFPLKGQWSVEAVVSRSDDIFQEVKRYVIQ